MHDSEIYLISIVELLINKRDQINLGNYILDLQPDIIFRNDQVYYALGVRLRNEVNNTIEYGRIFCKKIDQLDINQCINQKIETIKYHYFNMLDNLSNKDKLDFILSRETKLSRKPFIKSRISTDTFKEFFIGLKSLITPLPPVTILYVIDAFRDINITIKRITTNKSLT